MFSHIAEESARLSHAFIGALFSVIIVFSPSNTYAIILLCILLYGVFILNTVALHFFFKATNETNAKYTFFTIIWFIAIFSIFGALFLVYTVDGFSPSWIQLTDSVKDQLTVGLLVFLLFLVAVNISHMHSCAKHKDGVI